MSFLSDSRQPEFSNSLPSPFSGAVDTGLSLLWRVWDEIDYGLILATPQGNLMRANHLARHELSRGKFLRAAGLREASGGRWDGGASYHADALIQAGSAAATKELHAGIRAAAAGRRQMLTLRHGEESMPLACVPLREPFDTPFDKPTGPAGGAVLLMLARQPETQNLALYFFARSHGLTAAEEGVLRGLCQGLNASKIAVANGVAESTVRTQIGAVRSKTGCHSVRLLALRVAALPPVVSVALSHAQ
jgi:DNA-binding NarL/FixJ family response regulator